jgi:hypothetical protein
MANVTISQLPSASTLTGLELVPIVQNGVTVQATASAIAGTAVGGAVTSVAATVPPFLSIAGSPITSSGTLAISYSGIALPIANGGTGSTSTQFVNAATNVTGTLPVANGGTGVTTSSGASSVVLRDANQNISVNAIDEGYTNTAASGTTITLTVASTRVYTITGSGGQVMQLPDATTLQSGTVFAFDNNQSSGAITVNNNSGTLIVSVPSGGYVLVNLLSNATAAGSWDRHDQAPSNVSWSTNTFDYAGSITGATWNGVAVATNRGGTGASSLAGASIATYAGTETLTNKRVNPRVQPITSNSATPDITTDSCDIAIITGQTIAITGITASGTPVNGQKLWVSITSSNTSIAFSGTYFEASGTVALPTTVTAGTRLDVGFVYNTNSGVNKWRCVASA